MVELQFIFVLLCQKTQNPVRFTFKYPPIIKEMGNAIINLIAAMSPLVGV